MRITFNKPEPAEFKSNIVNCICGSNQKAGTSIFRDFAWFADSTRDIRVSMNPDDPTQVAQVAVYGLHAGDEIWLNGLFHVDSNNLQTEATIQVRILKNGTAIYEQIIRIDTDQGDDLVPIPVQTVDVQSTAGTAIYTLVVSSNVANIDVFGRRALTAVVIRRS